MHHKPNIVNCENRFPLAKKESNKVNISCNMIYLTLTEKGFYTDI